jgi:hypothetical protein
VYPRKHEWVTVVDLKFVKDEARIKYFKLEELKSLETAKKAIFECVEPLLNFRRTDQTFIFMFLLILN